MDKEQAELNERKIALYMQLVERHSALRVIRHLVAVIAEQRKLIEKLNARPFAPGETVRMD